MAPNIITITRTQAMEALQNMREEAVREARRAEESGNRSVKIAWLYSQIGAYEFAQQLGLLTNKERQTLTESLRQEVNRP